MQVIDDVVGIPEMCIDAEAGNGDRRVSFRRCRSPHTKCERLFLRGFACICPRSCAFCATACCSSMKCVADGTSTTADATRKSRSPDVADRLTRSPPCFSRAVVASDCRYLKNGRYVHFLSQSA